MLTYQNGLLKRMLHVKMFKYDKKYDCGKH